MRTEWLSLQSHTPSKSVPNHSGEIMRPAEQYIDLIVLFSNALG
jgi:hypothetical protein